MSAKTRSIPGFDGERTAVDVYLAKHRPQNQETVGKGYPFNPTLRENFSTTANEYREPLETEDWWGLPYIETYSWEQSEAHDRRVQGCHRAEGNEFAISDDELNAKLAKSRPTSRSCIRKGSCTTSSVWTAAHGIDLQTGAHSRRSMKRLSAVSLGQYEDAKNKSRSGGGETRARQG
ncbi:hypothetical protein RGV33_33040 [Pseudomonas sp. Bout1]|uniref:hypothetical protein n=1 Tax=Pseudomonas sp. Bout1 TaxID=3048600 RepID=UPI002AB5945E|nr:hypothetical protein [Pseudomonas sp. Bout1]MDY7536449.1 hypothetical protein [Pseudomonas sp. Bout1]MEB0187488.1 hypothetical protein [Pseudomonas sp. Bout1]